MPTPMAAYWQPEQPSMIRLKATQGPYTCWGTPRFALHASGPWASLFNEALKRYNPRERE